MTSTNLSVCLSVCLCSCLRLSIIAFTSEQFILQKVIKEVWYVCMECMHHMLLPMLKWEHEGVQATPSVDFPLHHFTGRQCAALEIMMELLRVRI